MNILNRVLILLSVSCLAINLTAQTIKRIEVSQDRSFTDHVSLQEDTKDKDLMVKFVFDEYKNSLTVNLISYRSLFVFRENARYKQIIKRRKLKPDKFSYVVDADKGATFKFTKSLKSSIKRPRKKHVFRRWIDYDGLQPAPAEYKMVNDYIAQTFDILQNATGVSITLRDILLMDESGKSRPLKKKYDLSFRKDLDRTYYIAIKRNPCFGKEEETGMSQKSREGVQQAYQSLLRRFKQGTSRNSRESVDLFYQMKELLLKQYLPHTDQHACMETQQNWDIYNCCVDSIRKLECRYQPNPVEDEDGRQGVSPDFLLEKAHLLDKTVSQWLLTNDKAERKDLIERCKGIMAEVKAAVVELGLGGGKQQAAMNIYQQAVNYYKTNCISTKESYGR